MSVPIRPRVSTFNRHGVWAIYKFEIARALRTLVQSLVTPVITTSLVLRGIRRRHRLAHERRRRRAATAPSSCRG